jgi:SAM-dependent methyltransferase
MRRLLMTTVAAGGVLGAAVWWRTHPSPCPYGQRFWVESPHPIITRERLLEVLAPVPGERLLELGPGTGYYTIPVAQRLDDGRLFIADIQQQMLDHTMRRAADAGISNVEPALADAQSLPYADGYFDGAFTVTALGEVPDPDQALRELARVSQALGTFGGRGTVWGSAHGHFWLAARSCFAHWPARGAPPGRSAGLLRAAAT